MSDFSTLIKNWYLKNSRNLPWREDKNPYKVWLSEIILQQTRISQGTDYYLKFIKNYPSVKDLAKAPEDEILKLWQGLGYYSRARNLHSAAKQIVAEYNGKFPDKFEQIIQLKGVGEYTASAISSISFSLPYAVVDGNVYRVLSRVFKINTPINSNEGKKEFQKLANLLISKENPGDYNQGLMELGSLICLPKNPKCIECPIQEKCLSFEDKTQLNYPVKLTKLKIKHRFLNYLIITNQNNILIKKRDLSDIWAGLYDFFLIETESDKKDISNDLKNKVKKIYLDKELNHVLTHQKLKVKFWIVEVDSFLNFQNGMVIIPKKSISEYPLPQVIVKYLKSSHFFE